MAMPLSRWRPSSPVRFEHLYRSKDSVLIRHSIGTMGGRENFLEGHAVLHDSQLGSIERWCKQQRTPTHKNHAQD
jgi:hypothetical protein